MWVSGLVGADVNFFNAPDWSGASFWQWFWRPLYCLYRLVSALADTRQLYIHSQCTCSTCVHSDTPEVPPSCGWRRNFAVSRWVRSLHLHKIEHNTVMKSVGIFLAWASTLQSWASYAQKYCSNIGTSIDFFSYIFRTVYSMGIMNKHDWAV